MNAENWDEFSGFAETLADAWDSLDDDQKAELFNRILSAADGEEMEPGNEELSEIQRSGAYMVKVGNALIKWGGILSATVIGASIGVPMVATGTIYKLVGEKANEWTPQRCVEFAAWASQKHPRFYGIFCDYPWLLYGAVGAATGSAALKLGPSEGWYLCSACPWSEVTATPEGVVLTPFPELTLTPDSSVPTYPWIDDSPSSSSSSSSSSGGSALLLGLGIWAASKVL